MLSISASTRAISASTSGVSIAPVGSAAIARALIPVMATANPSSLAAITGRHRPGLIVHWLQTLAATFVPRSHCHAGDLTGGYDESHQSRHQPYAYNGDADYHGVFG